MSVALLGALFFAGILLLLGVASTDPALRAGAPGYVFLAAIVGLGAVFYLGYASLVVLKNVCLLCVATYVAVIGLFVSAAAATRTPMRTLPGRLAGDLSTTLRSPAAAAAAVAFVVLSVVAIRWFPAQAQPPKPPRPARRRPLRRAGCRPPRRRSSRRSSPRSSACR